MCYAIPARVLSLDNENAKVDYGGIRKIVNISLVDGLKVGDFVLVHAGFAIQLVDKKLAAESLGEWNKVL